MFEVTVNGFTYYVDTKTKIMYEDKDKKSGTPMSFLTKNELEQVEKCLRFPRKKTERDEN